MIKLVSLCLEYCKDYIELLKEFKDNNSDLIPDILEIKCENEEDFNNVLEQIENRKSGNHDDRDWYEKGYYFLAYNEQERLVGIGCIRENLTKLAYDIWGNIACGVRNSERKKGYATEIVAELINKCWKMGMKEVIACHYVENEITPKILKRLGGKYTNTVKSPNSGKEIERYSIRNKRLI